MPNHHSRSRRWFLTIRGLVDRPLVFTVDELKRLPSISRTHFLECSGSEKTLIQVRMTNRYGFVSDPRPDVITMKPKS